MVMPQHETKDFFFYAELAKNRQIGEYKKYVIQEMFCDLLSTYYLKNIQFNFRKLLGHTS